MITAYTGKTVLPYYPTTVDIETAPDGTIIACGFQWSENNGERHYHAYDTVVEWFTDYIQLLRAYRYDKEIRKRLTRVYAHNGANFDYLSFYEFFNDSGAMAAAQYFTADSTGLGLQVELTATGDTVLFLDSYRLLPQSLAALTVTFNVENIKQVVPAECKHNYLLFKTKYPELFWSYLKADVMGLSEVVYAFWDQIFTLFGNVGHLPMTLPALVLRIFTKQLEADIYTPVRDNLKQLERAGYNGGLTLCMRTGVFDSVNVYDVNSMYPNVMRNDIYPISYVGYWSNEFETDRLGMWRATFKQHRQDVPPLLFDDKQGATYSGSGVYTTNELNYLTRIGGEFTITQGYVYLKTAPLFETFIGNVYELRKTAIERGDSALAFILKIMMNSLYGKFAQRETGDKIILANVALMRDMLENGTPYKVMGNWLIVAETREVKHAFVAIAAMITANARIDLHTRMCEVIDAGNEVYYCDTDSIHTNGSYNVSNELGGIKLENSGKAAYAGRKLYAFDGGKVKAKGIGRNVTRGTLSFKTIADIATNKESKEAITFTRFPSVKGVLSEKEKAGVVTEMTRNIRNTGGIWD